MTRYLLKRREDGLYRQSRERPRLERWGSRDTANIFNTRSGCKLAVQSSLYERAEKGFGYVYHPEWFDQLFEVEEVTI